MERLDETVEEWTKKTKTPISRTWVIECLLGEALAREDGKR